MNEDLDAYGAANLLIRELGDRADIHVAEWADVLLVVGDIEGSIAWQHILKVIRAIQTPQKPGEHLN
jgi:hypothetical protein